MRSLAIAGGGCLVTCGLLALACGSKDSGTADKDSGQAAMTSGGMGAAGGNSNGASSGTGGSGGMAQAGSAGLATAGGSGGAANGGKTGSAGRAGGSSMLGPIVEPGDPGKADVTLAVRADTDVHPISALIYGINGDCSDANKHPTLCRSGGNRLTAYNWENNASNAGSDWCFENDGLLGDTDQAGKVATDMLASARGNGGTVLLTVPIVDYVAADKTGGSDPPACSGDVRKSGADYLTTRFKKNLPKKSGALTTTPDATDDSVYEDEFVAFVKGKAGSQPVLFSLDNEPDIWAATHAEVHPDPVTYDELVERDADFAEAIRSVWPEAGITGFVSYGYSGYVNLQSAPDASGKGEFIDYYLSELRSRSNAAGHRLIDYLDLHWYPEATGGGQRIITDDSTAAVADARVQAPRSLWDPNYEETSWITSYTGGPIALIPWLMGKIQKADPDMLLAFTEWNYGGSNDISGAVAAADVLGVFGREGVALASLWSLSDNERFIEGAFQVFRDYDGAGSTFGDTSIHAESSAIDRASVYASMGSDDVNHVVIVAINRDKADVKAALTVAHSAVFTAADVWRLSASSPSPAAAPALHSVATNAFNTTLPARSISIVVPRP